MTDNLLGIPETRLPVDPAAAKLEEGVAADQVAAAYPTSSLAWATLAEEIGAAVDFGVVKMNVDTDTQYAFTRPVAGYMLANYDGVLKVDGEVGNKKQYDPRAWGKEAEAGMAARVVEACQNLRSAGTHA